MTDWGSTLSPPEVIRDALASGYDGAELWWPGDERVQRAVQREIEQSGAVLSLLVASHDPQPGSHLRELDNQICAIADSGIPATHVTLHAGRDYWVDDDHDRLADWIAEARQRTGLDILVELHRSRMLYAAHQSDRVLRRHPELRVAFDVSHWLTVAESMLDDQPSAVEIAIERADHVHARIGHPQGPQVNDPEADEWATVVDQHLRWWDRIVARLRDEGKPVTFLAEFGPPDYAPSEPGTRRPLRDQRSSNLWMQRTIRERYRDD
jgi:sugar phosphate isomerase/epimerase